MRGFDQQIANLIGNYMEKHKIRFQRGYVPIKFERIEEGSPEEGTPGRIMVMPRCITHNEASL